MPKTRPDQGRRAMSVRPMPAWAGGRRRRRFRLSRRLGWALGGLAATLIVGAFLGSTEPRLPSGTPHLTGPVERVVDGDTLDLAGQRIRLADIDAPEHDQTCKTAAGGDWPCGTVATARLRELVRRRSLDCDPQEYDRYGRLVAGCRDGAVDVARQLVAEGLAVASGGYLAAETVARGRRIGIWQGTFDRPADWRRQHGRDSENSSGGPSRFERFISWLTARAGS